MWMIINIKHNVEKLLSKLGSNREAKEADTENVKCRDVSKQRSSHWRVEVATQRIIEY